MVTIPGRDIHGEIPVARTDQDQRVGVVFMFKIVRHWYLREWLRPGSQKEAGGRHPGALFEFTC